MEIEQNFTESDFHDIYQVLCVANRPTARTTRIYMNGEKEEEKLRSKFIYCLGFVIMFCVFQWVDPRNTLSYNHRVLLYMVLDVAVLFLAAVWNSRPGREMTHRDAIRFNCNKIGRVVFEQYKLSSNDEEVYYSDIKYVVEFNNLLFWFNYHNKVFVMKAEGEEKEAVLSLLRQKDRIRVVKKEEPFSFDEFMRAPSVTYSE